MMNPHPVDIHVGKRLRLARNFRQLSQSGLARSVGVTFQQVQKYETGANRVSASRLVEFATILEVNVAFFFQDLSNDGNSRITQSSRRPQPGSIDAEIAIELASVRDAQLKRALLTLIRRLARKEEEAQQQMSLHAAPDDGAGEANVSR
jgi:transcriptional regulator with XRE-family HTH domain